MITNHNYFYTILLLTGCLLSPVNVNTAKAATVTHGYPNGVSLVEPAVGIIRITGETATSPTPKLIEFRQVDAASVLANLETKIHCPDDFRVESAKIGNLDKWFGVKHRTEDHTFHEILLVNLDELRDKCQNKTQYDLMISIETKTECKRRTADNGLDTIGQAAEMVLGNDYDEYKEIKRSIEIPLHIICEDVLLTSETYAKIENAAEYSCPQVPKSNEYYWANHRLVVEGTYSYKVILKKPQSYLRCVRIRESDGSNMENVFYQYND